MEPIKGFTEAELANMDAAIADVDACADALRNMATKPSAALVESALHMANTELARVAFNSAGSARVIEFPKADGFGAPLLGEHEDI